MGPSAGSSPAAPLLWRQELAKEITDTEFLILNQDGDIEEAVSPNFLSLNWLPAFKVLAA